MWPLVSSPCSVESRMSPLCMEGRKEGVGMSTGYLWRARRTGMDERCRAASLSISSRSHKGHASEHQAVRYRQKRQCWEHRKQQMAGPRAAGVASSVITFSCSLGFPELGVWGSQRLEGRQLRVTGMLCRKAGQRSSAVSCFLPLHKALCWS